MDYCKHTQERFLERFVTNNCFVKNIMTELTKEDYYEICLLCRDEEQVLLEKPARHKGSFKKVIVFNNIFMFCITSARKKIVKTIYPVNEKMRRELNQIYIERLKKQLDANRNKWVNEYGRELNFYFK